MEIYLDNAATTRPLTEIAVSRHMQDGWYNPSSAYAPAERIFSEIKKARELLLSITVIKGDCIFTSGGTEANNMAVMSAFKKGAHFITSTIEHPSVYNAFKHIEALGASVDYVKPRGFCINAQDVAALVKENTALVSVMHVNNETGAVNDIAAINRAVKAKNKKTLFHSDGIQALFKTNLDLAGVDYYTVSAHKIHALKGTGAVLAKQGRMIRKLSHGGEQELSLRPGTENTLGIQSFSEALQSGIKSYNDNIEIVTGLSMKLAGFIKQMDDAVINLTDVKVPHIINVSFPGVRAEVLVRALGEKGVYIGAGAACSKGKISRVLTECGVKKGFAESAVRISLSALNTQQEIEACAQELETTVKELRKFGRR